MLILLHILKIELRQLRSNGHFQLMTQLMKMLGKCEGILSKIQHLFDLFIELYDREDEALKKIRKSPLTDSIKSADRARNGIIRGMYDANRSGLNHYDDKIKQAATRLQVVLDAYGNIAKLSIAEKTSAIYNIVRELADNHEDDVVTVGLDGWADQLNIRNAAVDELINSRFQETAGRPDVQMRAIRTQVDDVYRAMMFCIDALWLMAPTEEAKAPYAEFIRQWNAVVDYYNNLISHQRGRGDKGTGELPDAPELPEPPTGENPEDNNAGDAE